MRTTRRPARAQAGESTPAGRPRDQAVDRAILDAATELLGTVGPEGVTVTAVANRSGVARATIYLRYPTRAALGHAAIRAAMGRQPFLLTGDLETDLRHGAEQVRRILGSPRFRAALPMLVEALLRADDDSRRLYESLAPNRQALADEYRKVAPCAGLRTDIEAELAADLIIGGMLSYLLATGAAPPPQLAQSVVDVILDGLKIRA